QALDGVRAAAPTRDEAIVPSQVRKTMDLVGSFANQMRISELVYISHVQPRTRTHLGETLSRRGEVVQAAVAPYGPLLSSRPYPRTSSMACSVSPSMVRRCICSNASCSLILVMAKPTW